jgi:branched-chain amino acid transport system permease protein
MLIPQLIVNGLLLAGTYLLLAVGLNLIFGVLGVVNFAHGGMVVFAGLFVFWLDQHAGVPPVVAVVAAVVAVAAIGLLTQTGALSRIRVKGYDAELLSLLATYGVSLVLVNVSALAFGADYVSLPDLQGSWSVGSINFGRAATVAAIVGVACSVVVLLWLRRTSSGKRVIATAQSETGAEVCGINATVTKRIAFTVGSALAGLAGALTIFQTTVAPSAGLGYTVLAFVMIALGGLGNYAGAFVGALCLAMLTSFTSYYWSGTASSIAPYALLLIVMLARTRARRFSLV